MDMSKKTIEHESWFVNQYLHPIQIPNKDALYGSIAELGRSIGFFLSRKYLEHALRKIREAVLSFFFFFFLQLLNLSQLEFCG